MSTADLAPIIHAQAQELLRLAKAHAESHGEPFGFVLVLVSSPGAADALSVSNMPTKHRCHVLRDVAGDDATGEHFERQEPS